jgi:hypothetical protein
MCWHPVRGTGRGLVWSTFAASLDIDMDIDIEPSRTEVVAGD